MAWIAVLLGMVGAVSAAEALPADLILTHATVRTQSPAQPMAQAVGVRGGRIVYVGTAAGAEALRGPATQVMELAGRTVLPGLIDAHVHPALGEFLHHRLCDVRGFTVEQGSEKLRQCAATAARGDWVVGYGWYDLDNLGYDLLTRRELDKLVPQARMVVISRDLHTMWVNSRMLAEAGINKDTPSPPGGEIVKVPGSGEPTGMLLDAAWQPVMDRIQHESPFGASPAEITREALAHLNSLGITSVLDALVDDESAQAYLALDAAGQLTARVTLAMGVTPGNFRTEIPRIAALRKQYRSEHVQLGYVKVFADGNGEVGLASFLNHDGRPGVATAGYYTDEQMRELVVLAEQVRLPVFVHVIGDGAAHQVLDAIAAARRAQGGSGLRHTLTHLCWVDERDLPRFRELGVTANIQEGWLAPSAYGGPPGYDYARSTAAGALGPWLGGRVTPYRLLQKAGARLAAGSDWFYTEENPWVDLEAGATSTDPGGANKNPMLPEYAIDLPSLLEARTTGGAWQLLREEEIGAITVGRRADLVVVDRDPLAVPVQSVHETRVLMTLMDGRVIYKP